MLIPDARSGLELFNLDEVVHAAVSPGHAIQNGQQQYQTPPDWARFFNGLLPSTPNTVFDPQCAGGQAFTGLYASKYGFELDRRYADVDDDVHRLTGNCVQLWAWLDEAALDLRFECQVANPPFGLRWRLPEGVSSGQVSSVKTGGTSVLASRSLETSHLKLETSCDSTKYTWEQIVAHAAVDGYGWFLAARKTIEDLGIHQHPWAYLYQTFPAGMFKDTAVEVGVVHWWRRTVERQNELRVEPVDAGVSQPSTRVTLNYNRCDQSEHGPELHRVRQWITQQPVDYGRRNFASRYDLDQAWETLEKIATEEAAKRPPWNVWLAADGRLRVYLSTRFQLRRKMSTADVNRLADLDHEHPLTLTVDREARRVLRELVGCGAYAIEPAAQSAIEDALAQVERANVPILPATEYETVAYADEAETLRCIVSSDQVSSVQPESPVPGPLTFGLVGRADPRDVELKTENFKLNTLPSFTPGRRYPVTTGTYSFEQHFTRRKPHFDENTGLTNMEEHDCSLSGMDRYISIMDDDGVEHRFMERPKGGASGTGLVRSSQFARSSLVEHHDSELWRWFERPAVATVADVCAAQVADNARRLLAMQITEN